MTDFEFIFVLYALILGLSLVELLGGLGFARAYYLAARLVSPGEHLAIVDGIDSLYPAKHRIHLLFSYMGR